MLRKQGRRSFTVEVKAGTSGGHASIPAKPPRVPPKVARAATPAGAAALVFAEEVFRSPEETKAEQARRILPSLIVWEPPAPDAVAEPEPEAPLPRVRRVLQTQPPEEAPRRRGRPRKVVPAPVTAPELQPTPRVEPMPPAQVAVSQSPSGSQSLPVAAPRPARVGAAGLSRAERWKRRLPRACW